MLKPLQMVLLLLMVSRKLRRMAMPLLTRQLRLRLRLTPAPTLPPVMLSFLVYSNRLNLLTLEMEQPTRRRTTTRPKTRKSLLSTPRQPRTRTIRTRRRLPPAPQGPTPLQVAKVLRTTPKEAKRTAGVHFRMDASVTKMDTMHIA